MEIICLLTVCFVLFLFFVLFKSIGIICWSWLWITSPLWILLGLITAILITILITSMIIAGVRIVLKNIKNKKE